MNCKDIRLRRTTFTVTLRCTLKCRLCSADVIHYKNPPHYSKEFIAKELKEYFSIVDYVEWLQYSGGETLMNKELPAMIEEAMKYKERFNKLMLFTNGTLLPTPAMLAVFEKYRDDINIFLSNYGPISCKADELKKCLSDHGVSCTEKKYYGEEQHCGGWVDFGGWEARGNSEEVLCKTYSQCSMHTMGFSVVQEGEMHLCRKSYRGMELSAVERRKSDYLDLFNTAMSLNEKKEHLRKMLTLPYLCACDHCNATYGDFSADKRYKPAEQV